MKRATGKLRQLFVNTAQIQRHRKQVPMGYTLDADKNEQYPPAVGGGQQIDPAENRYARDKNGNEFYPKDTDDNEFMQLALGYIKKEGRVILPVNAQGKPIYPKEAYPAGQATQREVYPQVDGKYVIGEGIDKNQYYAKDHLNNEYYPDDHTVALYHEGHKRYAVAANANTIFPKDAQNNEYYLMEVNPCHSVTIPSRYAKDSNQNEFYPKRKTADHNLSEAILGESYAQDHQNVKFYPKDAYGNEFYLPEKTVAGVARTAAEMAVAGNPKRYAQTNDAKLIIPSINNAMQKNADIANPDPAKTDIVGRLIREGTKVSDFLTKLDGIAALKPAQLLNYKYIDIRHQTQKTQIPNAIDPAKVVPSGTVTQGTTTALSAAPFYKSWIFWILVIVSLIIKFFAVWWFFLRNKMSYTSVR